MNSDGDGGLIKLEYACCSDTACLEPYGFDVPLPQQEPAPGRRAHFTGRLMGSGGETGKDCCAFNIDINEGNAFGEYVGEGDYPDNSASFPKAAASTFDGLALCYGTRVIIYAEKNYGGEILLDATGPLILSQSSSESSWSHIYTTAWDNDATTVEGLSLNTLFPPETRKWHTTSMHPMGLGSMKIRYSGEYPY
jgi:hypothetical protein